MEEKSTQRVLRIGTRDSKLALAQAQLFVRAVEEGVEGCVCEVVEIKTKADTVNKEASLKQIGGEGVFTKELERRLLEGDIDCAVHSLKDMPTLLHEDLEISCVLPREDVSDALLLNPRFSPTEVSTRTGQFPDGFVLGTSSLRRKAQFLSHFPHITVKEIRGNLQTRLRKLADGDYDGIVLAYAGLKRLGMESEASEVLDPEVFMTAVGQGVIGVQTRKEDGELALLLEKVSDDTTKYCSFSERAFMKELGGGCTMPVAVFSTVKENVLELRAAVYSEDGESILKSEANGNVTDYEEIGRSVARDMIEKGAKDLVPKLQ